jgi:enamine deaminase RidA (YjgF/YER057c/UK114 family)
MGRIEDRLAELGLELPEPFAPPPGLEFKFDLVRVSGELGYVSGHLPMNGSDVLVRGRVGDALTVEQGYEAARLTTLSILASLKQELNELERVTGWVRALGLVQCAPGFDKPPAVINGFTDLVLELWGEAGRHARSAIGAAQLPFDVPVEIEAVVEVRSESGPGSRRRRARRRATHRSSAGRTSRGPSS